MLTSPSATSLSKTASFFAVLVCTAKSDICDSDCLVEGIRAGHQPDQLRYQTLFSPIRTQFCLSQQLGWKFDKAVCSKVETGGILASSLEAYSSCK